MDEEYERVAKSTGGSLECYLSWAAPLLPSGIKKMFVLPQARESRIELQHSQLRGKTSHLHHYTTLRLLKKSQGSAL